MIGKNYQTKLKSVRSELSRYTHQSVFEAAVRHLQGKSKDPLGHVKMMPWIAMFVVKQALLEREGGRVMSDTEFYGVANSVYAMQAVASSIDEGAINLKLRAMVVQQIWYQKGSMHGLLSLFRQSTFFANGDPYYSDSFEAETGVSLRSFYIITLYLLTMVRSIESSHVVEVNLYCLIYHLCPEVPPIHILAYLLLTSIRIDGLSRFIAEHRLDDSPQSEYFQETPFKYKPIVLHGDEAYIFNSVIFEVGIAGLVPSLLKKKLHGFKDRFGAVFERYVKSLLDSSGLDYWDEGQLRKYYKQNQLDGKVVDFVVFGADGEVCLIECKAVEPSDIVKASFDAGLLRRSLEKSFIKAIEQGNTAARLISGTEKFKSCKFRLVVITHEDHAIINGRFVADNIDFDLESRLQNGTAPAVLDLNDVLYVTIEDFENLMKAQEIGAYDALTFFRECCEAQLAPTSRKMMTSQFANEKLPNGIGRATAISQEMNCYLEEIKEILEKNKRYWDGRVQDLIRAREQLVNALHGYFDQQSTM